MSDHRKPAERRLRHHDCRTAAIICAKSESPPSTFRSPLAKKTSRCNQRKPDNSFNMRFLTAFFFYQLFQESSFSSNLWSGGRAQKSYRLATHSVNSKIVQCVLSHSFLPLAAPPFLSDLSTSIFSVSFLNAHSTKNSRFRLLLSSSTSILKCSKLCLCMLR